MLKDNENLAICFASTIADTKQVSRYDGFDQIFHYTSPEGLLGILREENIVLWFSQYDSLNDIKEGVHTVEMYRCVCDELLRLGRVDAVFYQSVRDIEPYEKEMFIYRQSGSQMDEDIDEIGVFKKYQKYVCCFSQNRDSLPMWNYYTKAGNYEGYNIGLCFWRTRQSDIQNCYGKGYDLDFFSVIYDDEEKKAIIRGKIEEIYTIWKCERSSEDLIRVRNVLSHFVKDLCLKFKQNCFQHEQEVRAILTVPKDSPQFEVNYRSKAGYIIPYIELSFPKEIVSGITVGPLLNDSAAVKNIKQFAKDYNYLIGDKDIQMSKIPIRY